VTILTGPSPAAPYNISANSTSIVEEIILANHVFQILLLVGLVVLCIFAAVRKRFKLPVYYRYNHIVESDIEAVSMVGCSEHLQQDAIDNAERADNNAERADNNNKSAEKTPEDVEENTLKNNPRD
jgi:hypothetical protein|tara:strand:- start:53 stop:430 length:378 start_codon:yes stop_codon:yes gene_type:complete